jgi:hypothetical protein
MNKKLLNIVGLAAVIGIGYYAWKSSNPKEPTPPNGGSKCAADEVEQQIYCIAAPCPTMCVKKKGFIGGTGFFNPIRGRNQDTSF